MIDKLTSIGLGRKLLAVGILMAITAAVTFHYTAQSYAKENGALTEALRNKERALSTAKDSIDNLVEAIADQNKAFDDFASSRQAERKAAAEKVARLEQDGKALRVEIAGLEKKILRPVVDVAAMSTEQVAAEIGECRRAVEINRAANTGELL